jgi:hypothetical protein
VKKPYGPYVGFNVIATLIISVFLAIQYDRLFVFILTLLPVSEAVGYLADRLSCASSRRAARRC